MVTTQINYAVSHNAINHLEDVKCQDGPAVLGGSETPTSRLPKSPHAGVAVKSRFDIGHQQDQDEIGLWDSGSNAHSGEG